MFDPPGPTLTNDWLEEVVTPSDIGRPAIVSTGPDRAFLCAAKGVNRPPEMGVECALLNAMTGEILFKDYIHESDPGNAMYFNQPSVALVGNNIAIQTVMSSGDGKNTNDKGESTTYLDIVEATDVGMQLKSTKMAVGPYQAHPGMCSSTFGAVGEGEVAKPHAALFQAPITGAGQPALMYVDYDDVSKNIILDMNFKFWFVGWYADSGYMSNIYGQNPNDQGRDFLRCVGNVPNPGYKQAGGFKPTVKTFTVAPHSGRMYGEEPKNALWLGLVPAETEKTIVPEPPDAPTKPPVSGEGNPPGTDPSDPSGRGQPTLGNAANGCGCVVAGERSTSYGALLALALGMLGLARRRRGEV
jgi:MYXO-CTERM domain-containing protein